MVKSAFKHAKTAFDTAPNDASIKTFYDKVVVKHDEVLNAEKVEKEEQKVEKDGPASANRKEEEKGEK